MLHCSAAKRMPKLLRNALTAGAITILVVAAWLAIPIVAVLIIPSLIFIFIFALLKEHRRD